MFAPPELAADIDRAEGRLCAGIARAVGIDASNRSAVIEVGGGMAIFAGPGSPTNKMIGVGFDRVPLDRELDAAEALFADRRAPLQAEVATLADPLLHAALVRRGYEPRGFENVLGRPIGERAETPASHVDIAVAGADQRNRWVDVLVNGFASPDTGGVGGDAIPPSDELRQWMRQMVGLPGFVCIAAHLDGVLVGGGSLRLDGRIAQLCGAATLPAFRRRGVQTALLQWRLAYAQAQGCTVAVVATQPGSQSQQNVQRAGFALLYARQLLVKENPS